MKQKMAKLLSLALLVAMVLSLCVPTAFAELPNKSDFAGGELTSVNLTTTGAAGSYQIATDGLEPYNPSFAVTSSPAWITVSSTGLVEASHSAIEHETGSLRAVASHNDEVTVSYTDGTDTASFKVSFTVKDNDAAVLNSALDALAGAASGGGSDGLLNLLKHIAGNYTLGAENDLDKVLITKSGSGAAMSDLAVRASGLSGVTAGEIGASELKVNLGDYVGTLVYGSAADCKVESVSQINEETNRQKQINDERTRLTTAASGSTEHEKLENVLKAMAEKNYTVDASVTDGDELLLQKKGSLDAIKSLLDSLVTGITGCTTDSNGLIVRLTESSVKYIGTMVSGNAAATKVEEETTPTRNAGTLTVVASGKGMKLPDGATTEYQIDLTGLSGVTYEYESGSWVTVQDGGKLTPKEHDLMFDADGARAVETHSETVTVKSGEKRINVDVTVVDVYAQQYNNALDALYAAIGSGNDYSKVSNALKYMAENYSNDPTVSGRDDIIMLKKGSGAGTQSLLVSVLKECGVTVKPGSVDANILHIYLTNGTDNYEGTITYTESVPRQWKIETKDFEVDGSAIVGYLSNAAVLTFPTEVNGNAITTIGRPGETAATFWNGKTVNEITIPASVTTVNPTIFNGYTSLKKINVDSANASYSSKDGALYSKDGSKLITVPCGGSPVALPSGLKAINANAIPGGLYGSIVLPQGVTTLENNAIGGCDILFIPDSVTTISKTAFANVTDVVVVQGSTAETFCKNNGISCHSVTKEVYSNYASKVTPTTKSLVAVQPQDRTAAVGATVSFTADILGVKPGMEWQFSTDGKTWKPYDYKEGSGFTVNDGKLEFKVAQDQDGYQFRAVAGDIITNVATLTVAEDLGESETLTLGDKGYDMSRLSAKVGGAEICRNGVGVSASSSVKLANGETALFTTASYKWDSDVHKRYPVSMQVWALTNKDGTYTMTHLSEMDNLLRYSGSSIRVTGKKGIRMITSISEDLKNKLINKGIGGFTLQEYGTCVAWDSALGGAYPVLGNSKSAFAYKRGAADPVYARGGGLVSYTNVLVGFTNDQCKPDMAMRPYAVLADKNGNTYTVYGGTVHRSIGYIAQQNKDVFKSGTDAYNFIWDIIHTVYGKDYKG